MHFGAGTVFWIQPPRAAKPHLFFVLTDPDPAGRVLIVNITTLREWVEDRTCLLRVADREHPGITNDSAVVYERAAAVEVSKLQEAYATRALSPHIDASPALVARLVTGARTSPHLPQKLRRYLP